MKFGRNICIIGGLLLTGAVAWSGNSVRAKTTEVNGIPWFNSMPAALAESKRTHKPILLLSMFGHIDEETPCANARTMRATLFKDPEFKSLAQKEVVLAWEMVREVPKVEIDLGDGKKIKRTVRGNAVMYLVNDQGKVLDAYPGVYTAKDFFPLVRDSIKELVGKPDADVIAYHSLRGQDITLTRATLGKSAVESPTLEFIGAKTIQGAQIKTVPTTPEQARFLRAASNIRDLSLTPMTPEEAVTKITGHSPEGQSGQALAAEIMQTDSMTNLIRVRPVVHLYFASGKTLPTPGEARDAILETILKIPYKDPYFGLKDVLLPGTK
ncbi:MAG: hypothetical protein JSS66_17665 [Armatimonadetes bacterium]|nr:hypothetical protein [Armatimonadota bacterium]